MEKFLGKLLVYAVLFAIAGAVGVWIQRVRRRRDLQSMPDPLRRQRLLAAVRNMRRQGRSHPECIAYLREQGLRQGLAEGMLIDLESENPPDLQNARTENWGEFTFRVPGNWRVQPFASRFSKEPGLTIETLGSGMLQLLPSPNPEDYEILRKEMAGKFVSPRFESLHTWAGLAGTGVEIRGVMTEVKLPTNYRILRLHSLPNPLLVLICWLDEDESRVRPAVEFIESSFGRRRPAKV